MRQRTSGRVRRSPLGWTPLVMTAAVVIVGQVLWTTGPLSRARAQEPEGFEGSVFMQADRKIIQSLRNAQELLDEKRYSEAVRLLNGVLEGTEDYFYLPEKLEKGKGDEAAKAAPPGGVVPAPPRAGVRIQRTPTAASQPMPKQAAFRSLKSEAQRLIGQMPAPGREAYELQFGAEARRLLDEAAQAGKVAGLAEVSRRFFHTRAGHDATELLGTCMMERDQPLAAALCFQRLSESPERGNYEPTLSLKWAACLARAGQRTQAETVLDKVAATAKDQRISIDGREAPLSDRQMLVAWLDRQGGRKDNDTLQRDDPWLVYRGDAARNAVSSGSTPLLNRRWAVPTLYDPEPRKLDLERLIEQRRLGYSDQGQALLPAAMPLAMSDHVILRTVLGVMAVNFRTGKRIWFQEDSNVRQQLDRLAQVSQGNSTATLPPWLEQRLWNDAIYGTISSDGEYVFCVEDLPLETALESQRRVVFPNGRANSGDQNARRRNRLAVYGLPRQGALECASSDIWKEEDNVFFLAPPLPLDGRYYGIVENNGEIRLVVMKIATVRTTVDPRTGKARDHHRLELDWSQQLAAPERNISEDGSRRLAGASPSYADGVMVCPTTSGAIVAVDLTTRSLLWGYQYPRADVVRNTMVFMPNRQLAQPQEGERWSESTITIADGKVIVAPVETQRLLCIDLASGKLLWDKERDDGLLVAGVHQMNVVVLGSGNIRAHKLADGERAWGTPLPSGATPSGRGFFTDDRYCLPLSSAEVAMIDLKSGEIQSRARARDGRAIGNLICYQGAVLSQSADSIESFYQLSDLQTQVAANLAKNPEDAAALALQGDLLLDEGKLNEAIVALRRSQELRPDQRTRQNLFDALLQRAKRDFAAGSRDAAEIEALIDQPAQRLSWQRTLAVGLHDAGKIVPAFETYLRIMAEEPSGDELERIDRGLAVRRDRWVQARVKDLRDKASADELTQLENALQDRLQQAIASPTPDLLHRFVDFFGSHALADEAREALLDRPGALASRLEEEQLLRHLEQSKDPVRSRGAVARMVRMLHEAGRDADAASHVDQLRGPLADLVCLDGKTGQQLVKGWYDTKPPQKVTPLSVWPQGKAITDQSSSGGFQNGMQNTMVDIRGDRGPFLNGWSLEFAQQPGMMMIGRDRLGREQWRVGLAERNQQQNPFIFHPSPNHARIDGHLVVVTLGYQMMAIDTLGTTGREGPRVLWRQDLVDPSTRDMGGFNGRVVNKPWGAARIWAVDPQGRPLGTTGPLTSELICFQRQRNLICLHPVTGRTLWTRYGVTPGSELFGDKDLLFVVPSNSSDRGGEQEAIVYRTLDGQELGRRKIPSMDEHMTVLGRKVVTWSVASDKKPTLKLRDLWAEKDEWSQTFSVDAKPWPIGDESVGVMEKSGHLTITNVSDGKATIDINLREEPSLMDLVVMRSAERDIVVVNHQPKDQNAIHINFVPQGNAGIASLNGWIYGFDRRNGKLVWERQVERRSLTHMQPPDLPLIAFASVVNTGGGSPTAQVALMCLDKRDGRVVYDNRFQHAGSNLDLIGDPEKNEVLVRASRTTVRIAFTKDPIDDKPADEKKVDEKKGAGDAKK